MKEKPRAKQFTYYYLDTSACMYMAGPHHPYM